MNVIISNKYQALLSSLDIDVIKMGPVVGAHLHHGLVAVGAEDGLPRARPPPGG